VEGKGEKPSSSSGGATSAAPSKVGQPTPSSQSQQPPARKPDRKVAGTNPAPQGGKGDKQAKPAAWK